MGALRTDESLHLLRWRDDMDCVRSELASSKAGRSEKSLSALSLGCTRNISLWSAYSHWDALKNHYLRHANQHWNTLAPILFHHFIITQQDRSGRDANQHWKAII